MGFLSASSSVPDSTVTVLWNQAANVDDVAADIGAPMAGDNIGVDRRADSTPIGALMR